DEPELPDRRNLRHRRHAVPGHQRDPARLRLAGGTGAGDTVGGLSLVRPSTMKREPGKPIPCPCGLPVAYADCCGRWHHGPLRLRAPDAQALMRSRYSAYVLDELDYLLQTWHPDPRPATLAPQRTGHALAGTGSAPPCPPGRRHRNSGIH